MQSFWIIVSVISLCKPIVGAQSRCSNEPDGSHLPMPNNRNAYVICSNGLEQTRNCGNGQEFNPFDLRCSGGDGGNANIIRSRPSPGSATLRERCFNQADNTYLPDPTSRNRFILCTNGDAISGQCGTNEVFNEQSSSCELSRQPVTRPPNSLPTRPQPATTVRSPPARPMATAARTTSRPTRPPLNQQPANTGNRFNQPPPRPLSSMNLNQRPIVAF